MKHSKQRAVKASQPKAPPLDLSSVCTTALPENPPANPPTRIFGLEDAPCYYPTAEEFMEPLRYVDSIRSEAEKAGICKIIPPEGWKPTFALDSEAFRFRTRIQKLNSMEGETRTNLNYLEQLHKFHSQQGHPVHKIPQLDKRPIDLFRLKKEVAARGGYQKVTAGKKWAEVGRDMDYTRKQVTSLSSALKSAYLKVILPYEIYLSKQAKMTSERLTPDLKRDPNPDMAANGSTTNSQASATSTPSTVMDTPLAPPVRKSKRIKKDPISYAGNSDRTSSEPVSVKQDDLGDDSSDVCELCHTDSDLDKMLICDGCELGYHMYCLKPPLQQIPKADWYCAKCLVAGDDFGFEEGEEYSLSSFQQKCDAFKKSWFEKVKTGDGRVSEDAVEREFWRLVENTYETVEVEYGADLHSTQHGSGFPTLERNPGDKYAAHPANLNNIPFLPESLFSHIKSDISGIMVPWLYVGMCFSTFCWHNEDHYTYSINYMHWGDTKTWYGVPASDALKFESTMREAVPELFEQQPDLLFQLVTMLSPERLVANGVKVVALDQRPGQFVVTFPQAYHAGFNHGFNFAEAVNFAPPDWCHFGKECVQRYKEHRKAPVFSHDELIMTTALNDSSIATAHWLRDEIKSLLDRELAHRQSVLNRFPAIAVVMDEKERTDEEIQCVHCNSYAYLSHVGCQCTARVACQDHISELCKCDVSAKFLRLRYPDDYLKEITQRVLDTAAIPDNWIKNFRKTMLDNRVPSLKLLRSQLAAAERIPFPIKEAGHLRKFVDQANEWVEIVTKVLVRKHHHQGRRLLDRSPSNEKRLEDLKELLRQAERLRFDCQEIKQLEESIETMQAFQVDARRALSKPEHDLKECRELYEAGIAMNIGMDEIDKLDVIVKDLTWIERAAAKGVHLDDYQIICSLVADAEKGGVSSSNPLLMDLIRKQDAGQLWEERAQKVMRQNPVDLRELQAAIETGRGFPVPRNVFSKAEQLYSKVVEWEKMVGQLVARSSEPNYEERPSVSELKRALKIADSNLIAVAHKDMFEMESRKYDEWLATCQSLFIPSGAKRLELEEALEDLVDNLETCTADEKTPASAISSNGSQKIDPASRIVDAMAAVNEPMLQDSQRPAVSPSAVSSSVPPTMNGAADNQSHSPITSANFDAPEAVAPTIENKEDDPAMDVDREDQVYCLCRSSEAGMMVECDECHEWYHGTCVRMTKREASAKSNYICPVCNLSLVIRRDLPRPTLDMVASCFNDGLCLRFFTPEVPLLGAIVDLARTFEKKVIAFLEQSPITTKDIPQVKAFLRKIEGLDIELATERDALRSHILRLCPNSMPTPGVMLSNYPSAPPLSTINSNCLCRQEIAPVELQGVETGVMIQCGVCQDWYHTGCVGLSQGQAQRLNKFSCPVCCIVRKKSYQSGEVHYHDEVHARAAERIQLNKIEAEAKRKRRKPSKESIDQNGEPIPVEEKKKRPYKRREQTENGEKVKPKRRKSIAGPQPAVAVDSNYNSNSTVPVPQAVGQSTSGTTLPSFSEGFLFPHHKPPGLPHFLLPHDRLPSVQQQQQQQQQQEPRSQYPHPHPTTPYLYSHSQPQHHPHHAQPQPQPQPPSQSQPHHLPREHQLLYPHHSLQPPRYQPPPSLPPQQRYASPSSSPSSVKAPLPSFQTSPRTPPQLPPMHD
ncbi:hypothetical protein BGX28_007881 [Mortierella sp. GBA30]|nr:hypothetical protein BGX28_007881 [Mortierella sp. GBA30]